MTRFLSSISIAAFTVVIGNNGAAHAAGIAVEHQNARAMGAAYAGAQARKADSGFASYNPAAIAGIKKAEASSNATVLWGPTGYENASATLLGVTPVSGLSSDDRVLPPAFVPGSAIAVPLGEKLTIGLTVTSPFGLRSEYDVNSVMRYYAHEASLLTLAVSPTLAMEVTPNLSIGASIKVEYMDLTASTVVDAGGVAFLNSVPGFAPGSSDLFSEFKGDDIAIGFTAGFQAQLSDAVRVGFSYASKIEHEYDGTVEFQIAGSPAAQALNGATGLFADSAFTSTLVLPASYALGTSYDATEKLRFLGSVSLMRWSAFDQIVFAFENPVQPPEVITSNWSDSWSASVGVEYSTSDNTTWRTGFLLDQSPVDDALAAPRIPDTDRKWLTFGVTQQVSERISIDLAGGLVFGGHRDIRNDGTAAEDFLRGALSADIETDTYAVSGRLRFSF